MNVWKALNAFETVVSSTSVLPIAVPICPSSEAVSGVAAAEPCACSASVFQSGLVFSCLRGVMRHVVACGEGIVGELFSNQHLYAARAECDRALSVHSRNEGESRCAVGRVDASRIAVLYNCKGKERSLLLV